MELAVVLVELVVVLVAYLDEADVVEIWYVLFVAVLVAPVDALVVCLDLADAVEILLSLSLGGLTDGADNSVSPPGGGPGGGPPGIAGG